jgi:hypothetical protein
MAEAKKDVVRSSIEVSTDLHARLKAEAEKDRRGWTHEVVVLAEEALAAREAKAKSAA